MITAATLNRIDSFEMYINRIKSVICDHILTTLGQVLKDVLKTKNYRTKDYGMSVITHKKI